MFNRVKTIGLLGVGLLAMLLGTKAEAHYMYMKGTYYYHSVGCEVTIGDFPPFPDPLVVGCVVTTAQVEAKCSTGSIVSLSTEIKLSNQQNVAPGVSDVEVIVDDAPLLTNPSIVSACGGIAIDVLIRSMLVMVPIQCRGPSSSCLTSLVTTSTAMATYNLPAGCTLDNCPNNKRTYTMGGIVTHVN